MITWLLLDGVRSLNSINYYKEIDTELECLFEILEAYKKEYDVLYKNLKFNMPQDLKSITYKEIKSKFVPISFDRIIDKMNTISENIIQCQDAIDSLMSAKRKIEIFINKNDGIKYEIAYLRYVKGLKLNDVAAELHISYDRIKHINKEISSIYDLIIDDIKKG